MTRLTLSMRVNKVKPETLMKVEEVRKTPAGEVTSQVGITFTGCHILCYITMCAQFHVFKNRMASLGMRMLL